MPELLMQVGASTSGSELNFFEPLAPGSAKLVARHVGLPGNEPLPECVIAQGFWSCGSAEQLKITLQRVIVGSYEYTPGNTGAESIWTAAAPGLIGHGGATGASRKVPSTVIGARIIAQPLGRVPRRENGSGEL